MRFNIIPKERVRRAFFEKRLKVYEEKLNIIDRLLLVFLKSQGKIKYQRDQISETIEYKTFESDNLAELVETQVHQYYETHYCMPKNIYLGRNSFGDLLDYCNNLTYQHSFRYCEGGVIRYGDIEVTLVPYMEGVLVV